MSTVVTNAPSSLRTQLRTSTAAKESMPYTDRGRAGSIGSDSRSMRTKHLFTTSTARKDQYNLAEKEKREFDCLPVAATCAAVSADLDRSKSSRACTSALALLPPSPAALAPEPVRSAANRASCKRAESAGCGATIPVTI